MELEEIQQMQFSTPVNGRLRRRTWLAVIIVMSFMIGLVYWANHRSNKRAHHFEQLRHEADSLAHEERLAILNALLENRRLLLRHDGILEVDRGEAERLDSLYLENLKQQKAE